MERAKRWKNYIRTHIICTIVYEWLKWKNQGDRNGPDRQQAWRDKKLITVLFVKKKDKDQLRDLGIDVMLVLPCVLDAMRVGFCLNCIILLIIWDIKFCIF